MSDILIRNVPHVTKEILKRHAARHGRSLQAHLRDILDRAALKNDKASTDDLAFGSWLHAASRPGVDLTKTLKKLRSGSMRIPKFD
jgi:plasmid stability protein